MANNESLINTMYNEKEDIYYIDSLTYYRKITFRNYNKLFKINPVNAYNKFKMEKKDKNKINKNTNDTANNNNINLNDKIQIIIK